MKRYHPLAGFLLVLVAVFITSASSCGAIGHGIHRVTLFLIGHTGESLLVTGLLVSGLVVSGLGGLVWRCGVALWRRRSRPQLVRPATQLRTVTPKTFHVVLQAAPAVPPPIVVQPVAKAAPVIAPVSNELATVRSGLKYMGYKPAEIESAMQQIDTTTSVEAMLRAGLTVLRKKAA